MTRSITAEITMTDGNRTRRLDFGIHQSSPRKWRAATWMGYNATDHTREDEARKVFAAKLREWADHIEKTPFPKD